VGKNLRGSPIVEAVLAQRQGTTKSHGVEKIERIYGMTEIRGTDWLVFAGTTSEYALAGARQTAKNSAFIALMLSIVVLILVFRIAKFILKPVYSIRNTAQRVAAGDLNHRATVGGPLEIVEVASQFNNMLGSITDTQLQLGKSQERLRLAMEGANLAWWELDIEQDTLYLSDTWSKIVGGVNAKNIYRSSDWRELIPHEDFSEVQINLMEVLRGPKNIFKVEHRVLKADGTLIWMTSQGQVTLRDAQGRARRLVGIARDITERKAYEAQIEKLAFYDALTGLPNRRLLMDRLELALLAIQRHERLGALLFIDLDHFKVLNDTLGHLQGDRLLVQVADRLRTCIREGDTAARLGGDEFLVMLSELSDDSCVATAQVEAVGKKILFELNQPYTLANQPYKSTPSIGITLLGSAKGEDVHEALKRADMAMYQAKHAGRNNLHFYDARMQAAAKERLAKEARLAQALAQGEFVLHFQPQVAGVNRVTGAECLARWQHPEYGLVSPAEFIPLAVETGLIAPLGQYVMETACAQLAAWQGKPGFEHLTLAVNVSAKQFYQADFVESVLATVEKTGINPQLLELELTEGLLLDNVNEVIQKMNDLKKIGIHFSMDDFGTGYSSLSYLKLLPLNQLKIDQGFVRDILVDTNDAAIAKMVIALADSLHLRVIAEGVETAQQRDYLASLGCNAYQGYFFSKPVAIATFEAFVMAHQ
jgi:diguanylate cyclase (GGDEF)-like protein/PAS domain S-box-containing protein